jgi:hypothetical protein
MTRQGPMHDNPASTHENNNAPANVIKASQSFFTMTGFSLI